MAEIFKKAYDQANRMLNTSGLSSIMFDISDWSMGGDLLGGGLTPKQAQRMTSYIYDKDPGADDRIGKSLQRFAIQKMNQPGGRDYSEEEILSDYYKDYPIPPDMIKKYYESLNDNGSGLSSIVYRKDGGRLDSEADRVDLEADKLEQYILDSKLPYNIKKELANFIGGYGTKDSFTGHIKPHTKLQRGASDFLKDIVVTATAPPGTPVSKGASMIPGMQTSLDLTRKGIQSLLQNKTIREKLARLEDSQRKPGSTDPIPPYIQLFIDQFSPSKVVDGKRYYTPITDENKSKYFDEKSQESIGKDLVKNLEKELKFELSDPFSKDYVSGFKKLGKLGAADISGGQEGFALGRVNYGSYDSRGNWQPGIPDWDGNFIIKDEYDWNRTHTMGPSGIARKFLDMLQSGSNVGFAEAVGGTVGPQEGEGRKIEFKVPGYVNPMKQMDIMNRLDRPLINPKGLVQLPHPKFAPLAQTEREDDIYSKGTGLPGIGWHHEAFNDPDDIDDFNPETAYTGITDFSYGMKHGGQTMPRGLSGIKKSININGQPHSLAWIRPDEASALKAMGGSGKKVDGIPAYYFDDPGYMMEEIESYYDPVAAPTAEEYPTSGYDPAPLQYSDVQYLSSDGQGTTSDRFGASGLTSDDISIDLSQADLTNEEAQALAQMHQSQIKAEMDRLLEGVPLSQEGSGRSDFRGLAQLAAQEAIPGASDTWNFESFAENYPWIAPFAAPIKGLGWLMGKDPNPVVSSYSMGGKTYNVYMDGTVKEQIKEDEYEGGDNEKVLKRKILPIEKVSVSETIEEEPTGVKALLARREDKPSKGEALQPQFDNIVAAGFSRQEAADMLDQPVNIFA